MTIHNITDTERELRAEIENLHTVMMAAAVEITEHWDAHCDAEGYGPCNLVRRLENGYPEQYGYNAQTIVNIEKHHDELRAEIERLKAEVVNYKAYAMHERSLGAEPWMMKCHELEQELQETSTALADSHQEIAMLRRADTDRQAAMVRLQGIEYNEDQDTALLRECYEFMKYGACQDGVLETLQERLGL